MENITIYLPVIAMGLGALLLLYYQLGYFYPLGNMEEKEAYDHSERAISILICARNEAENLRANLPFVLDQDLKEFEVIVVNDGSWDGSDDVLRELQAEHDHLKVITIRPDEKKNAGKKFALTLAIKKAAHDRFLLTDADCKPASRKWARKMSFTLTEDFAIGYGAYAHRPGLLNRLIRFDTFQSACLYFSKALKGTAYMGVGRNMAYTRSIYDQASGFKKHYHIPAGDDDLFVNANAKQGRTALNLKEESHTISSPKTSWKDWVQQKRRHLGVAKFYSSESKRWLGGFHLGQGLFYLGLVVGCVLWNSPLILLSIYLAKTLIQLLIVYPISRRLKEVDLLVLIPILEPALMMSNILISLTGVRSKAVKWK